MKKSIALLSATLLSMAIAACGDKEGTAASTTAIAGENVPPPAGQAWHDIVVKTEAGGYLMGNPNAAIKVAEYGSFTCPHCREFVEQSTDDIEKMVDSGRMSFEFRPYVRDPLDMTVALLAGCNGPEPYFPLSHQLFVNQTAMFETAQAAGEAAYGAAMQKTEGERFIAVAELAGLIDFVKQRGISEDRAKQCLSDTKAAEAIAGHVQQANTAYNITGTPTLLMNDAVVENAASWDVMKAKLKEAGL